MELFRTMALGLFLVGFVALSQRVEAFPERSQNQKLDSAKIAEIVRSTPVSVLEYEVVQFKETHVRKRDLGSPRTRILMTKAFGDDLKLWLEPAGNVLANESTPVYLAKVDLASGKVFYEQVINAWEGVGTLLTDRIQRASLVQGINSKGQHTYDGFLGAQNLVVKSLPESISDKLKKQNSSRDSDASKDSKTAYHVVYKAKNLNYDWQINSNTWPAITLNPYWHAVPDVVYPEIMVVVDHVLFKRLIDVKSTLMYVLTFWNAVDLLYQSVEKPKFKFNIARIIIGAENKSTPFIADNMYNSELINADKAFDAAKTFFYPSPFQSYIYNYDVAMIMTGLQMIDRNGQYFTLGIASSGGACAEDVYRRTEESLVMVSDDATFVGVKTAAHEFAHLLGSPHDSETSCGTADGYLMAPEEKMVKNHYNFSRCTNEAIFDFFRNGGGFCFENKPEVKNPLPKAWPGVLQDRDRQCRMVGSGPSCYTGELWQDPCSAIYCHSRKDNSCRKVRGRIPVDGTDCGDGRKCLHGKCLAL